VLHEGDIIVSGTIYGKVRTLVNDKAQDRQTQSLDGGGNDRLSEVPSAADKFYVVENEKDARTITTVKKTESGCLLRAVLPRCRWMIYSAKWRKAKPSKSNDR
jgi:translation initiation factor IF-2